MTITGIYVVKGWKILRKDYRDMSGYNKSAYLQLSEAEKIVIRNDMGWDEPDDSNMEDFLFDWFDCYEGEYMYGGCSSTPEYDIVVFPHDIDTNYMIIGKLMGVSYFGDGDCKGFKFDEYNTKSVTQITHYLTKKGFNNDIVNIIIDYTTYDDIISNLLKGKYSEILDGDPKVYVIPDDCGCCS